MRPCPHIVGRNQYSAEFGLTLINVLSYIPSIPVLLVFQSRYSGDSGDAGGGGGGDGDGGDGRWRDGSMPVAEARAQPEATLCKFPFEKVTIPSHGNSNSSPTKQREHCLLQLYRQNQTSLESGWHRIKYLLALAARETACWTHQRAPGLLPFIPQTEGPCFLTPFFLIWMWLGVGDQLNNTPTGTVASIYIRRANCS